MPALGAVAPERRRGALGGVEFLPIVAQPRQVRAAGIGGDVEIGEWVDLVADRLRHLLQLDPIEPQQRIGLQALDEFTPDREEAIRRHAPRKVARDQRGVVVAQIETEPAQPSRRAVGDPLETAPFGLDRGEVAVDGETEVGGKFAPTLHALRQAGVIDLGRRSRCLNAVNAVARVTVFIGEDR